MAETAALPAVGTRLTMIQPVLEVIEHAGNGARVRNQFGYEYSLFAEELYQYEALPSADEIAAKCEAASANEDPWVRRTALELAIANRAPSERHGLTVERAEAYLAFLRGEK